MGEKEEVENCIINRVKHHILKAVNSKHKNSLGEKASRREEGAHTKASQPAEAGTKECFRV